MGRPTEKRLADMTTEELRALSEEDTARLFRRDMKSILGVTDEEYDEIAGSVARRLRGEPHVHTRFCIHAEEARGG